MEKLSLDYSKALGFFNEAELSMMKEQVAVAEKFLNEKTGAGNDYLGWIELPTNYDKEEFQRIKAAAEKIKGDSDVLLVVGIGGSYLGARAAIDFLSHTFYNSLSKEKRNAPEIYYVGNNISGTYLSHLLDLLEGKDFSINVISKSGTTTEPAIAFRVLKKHIEEKYGKAGAKDRIYATTDKAKGALKKLADEEGYETFVIPDDVGGRFSVLTPVGLLPIACSGVNIDELMEGARAAQKAYTAPFLNRKGKNIEMLINYEPRLHYLGEWWKQLFGESEGKDGKGLFPAAADFSTDLHSMGQYIQDGRRELFETAVLIGNPEKDITIEEEAVDLDGLNYLSGKGMDFVNKKASQGTLLAHVDGGVPNLVVSIPKATPFNLGYLFYFFEKACGISGYLLGVNPFNQPGVESYKANMFALLGKKGYEKEAEILNKRLENK